MPSKIALAQMYVRAYRHLDRARTALRVFSSGDPWALPALFGIRNWFPIKHEPKTDRPVSIEIIGGISTAYVVQGTYPVPPRTKKAPVLVTAAEMDAFNADIGAVYEERVALDLQCIEEEHKRENTPVDPAR